MSRFLIKLGGVVTLATAASALPPGFHDVKMTHAVFSPLVFALFMPVAAILIRICTFRGVFWVHACLMIFSWILSLIALGTGIWLAQYTNDMTDPHAILGMVVIIGCALQPITGWVHHLWYKTRGNPNPATYPHVWVGRVLITLGAINGGLGLKLAPTFNTPVSAYYGYGIGAAVVWAIWMGVIILASLKSRGKKTGETGDNMFEQEKANRQMKQVPSTESEMDKEMSIA